MDNAAKALLLAGGVLITIIVVNIGIVIMKNTAQSTSEFYTMMDAHEISEFNERFTKYQDNDYLTMQDVVSIMNLARNYNISNNLVKSDTEFYINVIGDGDLIYNIETILSENNDKDFEQNSKTIIKDYVSNGYNQLGEHDDDDKTKPKKYFEITKIEYNSSQLINCIEIKQIDNE